MACLDDRAGAASVAKASELVPRDLPAGTLKARELRLQTAGETTRIEAVDGPGLFVYEFRVAHH